MAEPGERSDHEDEAERRIARARAAIGKSFEELIARSEAGPQTASPPPRPPAAAPPDIEGSRVEPEAPRSPLPPPPAAASEGANPDDIAAAVERRVSAWVDGRVRAAERRLELQSEAFEAALGGGAAIEARFSAAEATLRSRLDAAIDETATEQHRRMREEAASHRKRINEELAAALQSTAAELHRRLEADREGARRELSRAAREEIATAVERLDQLHSAAVREAREAAEAVATARLADAEAQIAPRFEASREESKGELDRGLSAIDSRVSEMFEEFRGAQEAAGMGREEEIRRRSDARIDELAAVLSGRVDREVSRRLAEAQADLERANAESAGRAQVEARAGVEAAVNREVAKGEARIAAAAESVDLIVEQRVSEGIAAIEQRLQDQLESRRLEAQQIIDQRHDAHLQAFRSELSSSSYQDHNRRAEAAATAQLARSLDALKRQQAEASAAIARGGAAERERMVAERTQIESELHQAVEVVRSELETRLAELRADAERLVEARAGEAIDKRFEERASDLQQRLTALAARNEQNTSMRLSAAVAEAEARLAAVDRAQEREEQIRVRISAAEREANLRVREAEQRLVEVLARIDVAGR